MRFGSVCSGIEAASVAWEPLGWEPAWFAEIEPYPSAVLKERFPNVPNYGDFTAMLDPNHEVHNVPPIDLLVAGAPCQDFSVAGLRAGIEGARGHLTLAVLHLARILRPRWLVYENVPGLLTSDGGRAFGAFLGGLEELGYGWSYRTLDAQYVRVEHYERAVPQRRRRVFVVGHLGADWLRPASVLLEPEGSDRDSVPRRTTREEAAAALGRGLEASGVLGAERPDSEHLPVEGGGSGGNGGAGSGGAGSGGDGVVALGFEPRYYTRDNKTGGAPAATVTVTASAAKARDAAPTVVYGASSVAGTLDANYGKGPGERGGVEREVIAIQDVRDVQKAQNGRGWNADGAAYTLDTHATQGVAHVETFRKAGRAQSASHAETWVGSGVCNTLNVFDSGETRATVVAVEAPQPMYTMFTGDGKVADPITANEGKTYTHEGTTFRMHNCVGEHVGFYPTAGQDFPALNGCSPAVKVGSGGSAGNPPGIAMVFREAVSHTVAAKWAKGYGGYAGQNECDNCVLETNPPLEATTPLDATAPLEEPDEVIFVAEDEQAVAILLAEMFAPPADEPHEVLFVAEDADEVAVMVAALFATVDAPERPAEELPKALAFAQNQLGEVRVGTVMGTLNTQSGQHHAPCTKAYVVAVDGQASFFRGSANHWDTPLAAHPTLCRGGNSHPGQSLQDVLHGAGLVPTTEHFDVYNHRLTGNVSGIVREQHATNMNAVLLPHADGVQWWDGSGVASTVTTHSDVQRMPDKGHLQCVVTPDTPAVAFNGYQRTEGHAAWPLGASDGRKVEVGVRSGMAVRRLTPTECERLMGFPPAEMRVSIGTWYDPESSDARAVLKSHKSRAGVWLAEGEGSRPSASCAEASLSTPRAEYAEPVVLNVLLQSDEWEVRTSRAGRCLSRVKSAELRALSRPLTQSESSAQTLALGVLALESAALLGREASHLLTMPSTVAASGNLCAVRFGDEMGESAADAPTAHKNAKGMSTTSSPEPSASKVASMWTTLCCSAVRAIAGYTQTTTRKESFEVEVVVHRGWTAIPWRGKPVSECPDGPRYKALGNSMAVNCMRFIGERIVFVDGVFAELEAASEGGE